MTCMETYGSGAMIGMVLIGLVLLQLGHEPTLLGQPMANAVYCGEGLSYMVRCIHDRHADMILSHLRVSIILDFVWLGQISYCFNVSVFKEHSEQRNLFFYFRRGGKIRKTVSQD